MSSIIQHKRLFLSLSFLMVIIGLTVVTTAGVTAATVDCPGDAPCAIGRWEGPFDTPVVGIHAVVLATGKVLLWSYGGTGTIWDNPSEADPQGLSFTSVPAPDNLFCSGHCSLADGRLLVIGGHEANNVGINDANVFDPFTETWTGVASMKDGRWYPTCTTLPDGRVLATSGDISPTQRNVIPEVYDPGSNSWRRLNKARQRLPMYPWMFVLPSGKVFDAGPDGDTKTLDVDTRTWTLQDYTNYGSRGAFAPAVMYEPGKILIAGGNDPVNTVTNSVETIDMTQPNPSWLEIAPMIHARRQHNATLLPNGQILVTGGTSGPGFNNQDPGIMEPELFDPSTGTWTEMAIMANKRVYHSTAFLLPDGRVVVTGTDDEFTLKIYSPPYFFQADGQLAIRPTLGPVPNTIGYGSSFEVGYTAPAGTSITSVALIRPSSVTHSFNMDQRYVPLTLTESGNTLSVQAPADANLAPPGYYMLFIVNDQGVPSVASFVKLGAAPAPPVTDVAITAVTALASVAQGDIVSVEVTVENAGNQELTSDINVTLTDDTDTGIIGIQTITGGLAAGASTTLTYSWDTGGASLVDHALAASHDFADDDTTNNSKSTTVTVDEPAAGVTVMSIDPGSMLAGTVIEDVIITGSGFVAGANVTFEKGAGPAPTANNLVFADVDGDGSLEITATVTAKSGGPQRNRVWDVVVTNSDASSGRCVDCFTVNR